MRGIWISTPWSIVAPGAFWRVDPERLPPETRCRPRRLWKCRRRGNHKPVSTAPWKSREEREIPTFPRADSCLY